MGKVLKFIVHLFKTKTMLEIEITKVGTLKIEKKLTPQQQLRVFKLVEELAELVVEKKEEIESLP